MPGTRIICVLLMSRDNNHIATSLKRTKGAECNLVDISMHDASFAHSSYIFFPMIQERIGVILLWTVLCSSKDLQVHMTERQFHRV